MDVSEVGRSIERCVRDGGRRSSLESRFESQRFRREIGRRRGVDKTEMVSGDREGEVSDPIDAPAPSTKNEGRRQ